MGLFNPAFKTHTCYCPGVYCSLLFRTPLIGVTQTNPVIPLFMFISNKHFSTGSYDGIKRIMLVDDEPDIVLIFKLALQSSGYEVMGFNDPQMALSQYKPGLFDLLILDIKMPHMTGFELYKEIRKLDSLVNICFLSAFENYYEDFKREFPGISEKCFLKKPLTVSELIKHVSNQCKK